MAVSTKPWGQFSAADYATPASYCAASLIDLNPPGAEKTKGNCKLPVREPGGALNSNGVHAAAARLAGAGGGVDAPPGDKAAAARKLIRLYGEIGDEVPDSIRSMAR